VFSEEGENSRKTLRRVKHVTALINWWKYLTARFEKMRFSRLKQSKLVSHWSTAKIDMDFLFLSPQQLKVKGRGRRRYRQ